MEDKTLKALRRVVMRQFITTLGKSLYWLLQK